MPSRLVADLLRLVPVVPGVAINDDRLRGFSGNRQAFR